jgi:hypothetical protein
MIIKILIKPNEVAAEKISKLQQVFSDACNEISEVAAANKCWGRAALHHLSYHTMRERYSTLGSQMLCNAIYAVTRAYKIVREKQPQQFNVKTENLKVAFTPASPVFFDKNTLSLSKKKLSLFTMDGRLIFNVDIKDDIQRRFMTGKLKEITLKTEDENYALSFNIIEGTESHENETTNFIYESVMDNTQKKLENDRNHNGK